MHTFELAPVLWSDYLDTVTREQAGSGALVRAGSRADGSGSAGTRPLRAIFFDAERGAVEIDVGGLDHARSAVRYFVDRPRRIVVSEEGDSRGILIVGTDGSCTSIRLERIPAIGRAPVYTKAIVSQRRTLPARGASRMPSPPNPPVCGRRRSPCPR